MRSITNKLLSFSASFIPLRVLKSGKNIPILLPFYHLVSDNRLPFQRNYNYPTVDRFKTDLEYLLKYFEPVTLEELHHGNIKTNSFHLTFDDGLRSCYEIVATILKQKGIPATFFINPAFVDNKDLFHRYKTSILQEFFEKNNLNVNLENTYADIDSIDETAKDVGIDWQEYLANEKPYMNLDEMKQLAKDGFSIGSHSWDHPEFWLLDTERQFEEINESVKWVVDHLSPNVRAFAFPFSDVGVFDEVFEKIKKENICDITFGTAGIKKELIPDHFQRLAMDLPGRKKIAPRIKSEYLSFHLKRLLNKHIAQR